jgi:hypothetical protein
LPGKTYMEDVGVRIHAFVFSKGRIGATTISGGDDGQT